jgi:hypothetical protein
MVENDEEWLNEWQYHEGVDNNGKSEYLRAF